MIERPEYNPSKFDRFELEQAIFSVWNSIDDLKYVIEAAEGCCCDEDKIMNMLIGIRTIQEKKLEKVLLLFTKGLEEGKIV
jgi:hypothetical protein